MPNPFAIVAIVWMNQRPCSFWNPGCDTITLFKQFVDIKDEESIFFVIVRAASLSINCTDEFYGTPSALFERR